MGDNLFERGHRPVMHVGAAAGDFAQPRRFESLLHLDDTRQELSPPEIRARKPDVMEAIIGEVPALMRSGALSLGVEEDKATLGFFGNRLLISLDPAVERRLLGNRGSFVSGDGLCERVW